MLARGLAVALLAGASQVALTTGATAQTAVVDNTVEEVVFTGVRGSQIKSVDVKRSQASFVDAISAEDIAISKWWTPRPIW
ncbi:hypothetical protein ACN2C6_03695 [Caulobacter sp. ErkDOM-YI]|uniref:hypothetical protein n=1 Tax=unclassified Caulobacter TaxID=2648921 RepID=UPI003AF92B94